MKPQYIEDINNLRCDLVRCAQQVQDLRACIKDACAEDLAEIQEIERQIELLRQRKESAEAEMRTRAHALFNDLEIAQSRTKKAKDSIKRYCHSSLPIEVLKQGLKLKDSSPVFVRVNKAQIERSYDAERLSADFPHLEDTYMDGDPVIGRTIVPEVLDRLISMGRFSEEDAAECRIERKVKNPSVTVEVDLG